MMSGQYSGSKRIPFTQSPPKPKRVYTSKKPAFVDNHGETEICSASLAVLFSFLCRQFKYWTRQVDSWKHPKDTDNVTDNETNNASELDSIAKWFTESLDGISKSREKIRNFLDDIAFDYPSSASARVFGCYWYVSKKSGDKIGYSRWFNTNKKNTTENHMILSNAKINHLLDEIRTRLSIVYPKIDKACNCNIDFASKDFFEKEFHFYNKLHQEFPGQMSKFNEYKKNHTKPKYVPKNKRHQAKITVSASSTEPSTRTTEITSESTSTDASTSAFTGDPGTMKFVSTTLSYASVVKKTISTISDESVLPIAPPSSPVTIISQSEKNVKPSMIVTEVTDGVSEVEDVNQLYDLNLDMIETRTATESKNNASGIDADQFIDMSAEAPTEAEEMTENIESVESVKLIECPTCDELIRVPLLSMENGKVCEKIILMSRSDFENLPKEDRPISLDKI